MIRAFKSFGRLPLSLMLALGMMAGAAKADVVTFDVVASSIAAGDTFSGTMVIDVTAGTLVSANIGSPEFATIFDLKGGHGGRPTGYFLDISDHHSATPDVIELDFTTVNPGFLVGFTGGTIFDGILSDTTRGVFFGMTGTITAETPLPAALPLFATGLGAMGLLGWRRKRKAAAVVA